MEFTKKPQIDLVETIKELRSVTIEMYIERYLYNEIAEILYNMKMLKLTNSVWFKENSIELNNQLIKLFSNWYDEFLTNDLIEFIEDWIAFINNYYWNWKRIIKEIIELDISILKMFEKQQVY